MRGRRPDPGHGKLLLIGALLITGNVIASRALAGGFRGCGVADGMPGGGRGACAAAENETLGAAGAGCVVAGGVRGVAAVGCVVAGGVAGDGRSPCGDVDQATDRSRIG